jgi:hypothetical protein
MAPGEAADRRPLVGRVGELRVLADLVRGAVSGRAGTLVASGEAGVGKTALLREGCRRFGDDVDLLWAGCLPLTSLAVPFLPLTSALREWAGRGVPVPVLAAADGRAAVGGGPVEFDAWPGSDLRAPADGAGGRRLALGGPELSTISADPCEQR